MRKGNGRKAAGGGNDITCSTGKIIHPVGGERLIEVVPGEDLDLCELEVKAAEQDGRGRLSLEECIRQRMARATRAIA